MYKKNDQVRDGIPEIATLYSDDGIRITFAAVRTSWIDYRYTLAPCVTCGYRDNVSHAFCAKPQIKKWTLRQARKNTKKELIATYRAMQNRPRYIVTPMDHPIPSGFRAGMTTPKDEIIASGNDAAKLVKKYGKTHKIWEMRAGGAMRDYTTAVYVGQ